MAQFVVHVFLLQDLLGFESFSAGLWFVCINFQLSLIFAATLCLRDAMAGKSGLAGEKWRLDFSMIVGWMLSVASVFFFNRDAEWDSTALYYYAYFFLGVILHHSLRPGGSQKMFWWFMLMLMVGMILDWRPRMLIALLAGLLIFSAGKFGWMTRWPKSLVIAKLGRISYSLFLVHFPVLVLISSGWARLGWSSPAASVAGLLVAFLASLATSVIFHRWVEVPAGKWSRHWDAPKKELSPTEYPSSPSLS